jgi:hypothetical protein
MTLFNFSPQQYYSRTPFSNQQGAVFYNPGQSQPVGNGVLNNIAAFAGYTPSNQIPGTVGYRLPAQSYANYGINNLSQYGTQSLKTQLINTAVNSAINGLVYGLTGGPSMDPTNGRLSGSGIAQGATSEQLLQPSNSSSNVAWQDDTEDRVIIYDQTGKFIRASAIFKPLEDLGGVLFPYTPTIEVSHKASYEMMNLVHTNYTTPAYQHSSIDGINITGTFTANYPAEAEYMVAMLHFFRSVTKMFYGKDQLAGTPPPVLFLDAYGIYTFDHIPVVVTSFSYSLPNDIDYISCTVKGEKQKVPTSLNVSLSLMPTYSRNKTSNEFSLQGFAKGALVKSSDGSGGWL